MCVSESNTAVAKLVYNDLSAIETFVPEKNSLQRTIQVTIDFLSLFCQVLELEEHGVKEILGHLRLFFGEMA